MTRRALSIVFLLGAGCFEAVSPTEKDSPAPIEVKPVPSEAPTSLPPTPAPAPAPAPAAALGPLDRMQLTKVLSWNVSGNTPLAAWSPNQSQLAVFSDHPQRAATPTSEPELDGKKFVDIIDMKTGALTSLGTLIASAYEPMWLDESTLVYRCTKDRCGKGKDGVYTLSITAGSKPQQILSVKKDGLYVIGGKKEIAAKGTYFLFMIFPSKTGTLLIKTYDELPQRADRTFPDPVEHWAEYDPKTQKLSLREDIPAQSWDPPASMAAVQRCSEGFTTLYGFAENKKIGIVDNATQQKKVIAEAELWTMYPAGDPYYSNLINVPCFSPEGKSFLYYTYDASKKQGSATLMKVEGLSQ